MNDSEKQTLIDLINKVEIANGADYKLVYYCCVEPSDQIKDILNVFGCEYKILPSIIDTDAFDMHNNTVFIVPTQRDKY